MHKLSEYIVEKKGTTESIINIELLNIIKSFDIQILIKEYKISNFFKGKFFIKRLINKIFKYKLNKKMLWNNSFWNKVTILNIKSSIRYSDNLKNTEMASYIEKKYSEKRLDDIYYYQKKLNKMDPPLYIDGYSLNIIGASINPNKVFMLDGSRRLIANLLNNKNHIDIYMISINKQE